MQERTPSGRTRDRIVRGDFQTPPALAAAVVNHLHGIGLRPAAVIEPTCGRGVFLRAARERFPDAARIGYEIDPLYAHDARATGAQVQVQDAFAAPWEALAASWPRPALILGNPPWVTTATLGRFIESPSPRRENPGLAGLSALTGAGTFDVSEWLIRRLHHAAPDAVIAMLCKVSVARRLLRDGLPLRGMWRIDAAHHFRAAVDAGLLILDPGAAPGRLPLYSSFTEATAQILSIEEGLLIEDHEAWKRSAHLAGEGLLWRSGIKHDAARILELVFDGDGWRNGLGEAVEVEEEVLWPLLKGGDLHHGRPPTRRLILTQEALTDDPQAMAARAPRAWAYLQRHQAILDGRRSRIWRRGPRFGVFGLGPYTWAPWKVAVAGLYPEARFRLVGPEGGRPVVFDDTSYAVSFSEEAPARAAWERLQGADVQDFLKARIPSRAKRPITATLLRQISIHP